jgi:prevent-host-death family protein
MTTVGSYQAKTHLSALLDRVAKGEQILITKHGVPVAVLAPPPRKTAKDVREVIAAFKAYSKQQARTLGGASFRDLVEEGRRG